MDHETDDENDKFTGNSGGGQHSNPYASRIPPTVTDTYKALTDLQKLLHPPWNTRTGYKWPEFDAVLKQHLKSMEKFLQKYTDVSNDGNPHSKNGAGGNWTQAANETATFLHRGAWLSQNLQMWSKSYIKDQEKLPTHKYGKCVSHIENEALAVDIMLHLQSIRKYIRAQDVVDYLSNPAIQSYHGLSKNILLATMQRWMLKMGYRWREEEKGLYLDGHECEDVVEYHQNVFLPLWQSFEYHLQNLKGDDLMREEDSGELLGHHRMVVWFHDKLTFYAHDHCKV